MTVFLPRGPGTRPGAAGHTSMLSHRSSTGRDNLSRAGRDPPGTPQGTAGTAGPGRRRARVLAIDITERSVHHDVTTHPAPARTDDPAPAITTVAVRRLGIALTAGTLAWAVPMFWTGTNPRDPLGMTITDLTGLAFQLGVFALLTVQLKTRATGTSRAAVALLKVEYVLLGLASVWSLLHGAVPAWRDATWLAVLDAFWPLSMLGMFIIGIKVAFAGRWRGVARIWPLIAETWVVAVAPFFVLVGEHVSDIVAPSHLIIGYTTLGVILAARPHLTGAR